MKKIFSIFLAVALLSTMVLPMTVSAVSVPVIAADGATRIELDPYFEEYTANDGESIVRAHTQLSTDSYDTTASGGYAVDGWLVGNAPAADANGVRINEAISISVSEAGYYNIKWVVNGHVRTSNTDITPNNTNNSPVELKINDVPVLKNRKELVEVSVGGTPKSVLPDDKIVLPKDNTRVLSNVSGATKSTAAYLFTKEVIYLAEGTNTVNILVYGDANGAACFLMDYIEFEPVTDVTLNDSTRIELDDYFGNIRCDWGDGAAFSKVEHEDASNGSYVNIYSPIGKASQLDFDISYLPTASYPSANTVRSFYVNVDYAGEYTIDFTVGGTNAAQALLSAAELRIDGELILNNRGTFTPETSPYESAIPGNAAMGFDLELYRKTDVALTAGIHKVDVVIYPDAQSYKATNINLDYIEFTAEDDYGVKFSMSDFAGTSPDSVTVSVEIANYKEDLSDINALVLVAMYDANGSLVKYETLVVNATNGTVANDTITVNTTVGTGIPPVASAKAFLRDGGEETTPTIFTATMTELAPMRTAELD